MTFERVFGAGAVILVIGGLVLAFIFLGTPVHQRLVAKDARRVIDLQVIASSLHDRYQTVGLPARLPADLVTSDPAGKHRYDYRRIDATHYELCAVFDTKQPMKSGERESVGLPRAVWRHGGGRTCYEIDVRDSTPMPLRD